MKTTPFELTISAESIADLKSRLSRTRLPEAETVSDWSQGVPLSYLKEVIEYWRDEYDMQRLAQRLNQYPQFVTQLDGLDIYFLHVKSPHENAKPLLMTHGWPGSVVEFLKVIGPLTNPTAHGGSAADAFHLVCPALPGYGFSGKPVTTGWSTDKTATQWDTLMRGLGYDKYLAQGGDWGSVVTTAIGMQNLGACAGIHVNMAIVTPDPDTMNELTPLEQRALAAMKHYQDWDSGYSKQQSTRPQTLGYGLVDSPSGQAAWILEKFWAWTDSNGHPENILSRDEMLDNIMVYWLSGSGASSARLYWESFGGGNQDLVTIPTGISIFPKEIFQASRRWAEKRFTQLTFWKEHEVGGHFAAFEQPEAFVTDIRRAFADML